MIILFGAVSGCLSAFTVAFSSVVNVKYNIFLFLPVFLLLHYFTTFYINTKKRTKCFVLYNKFLTTKIQRKKMTLYVKLIIQRKNCYWKTATIFFTLFWDFFSPNCWNIVFACIIHAGYGIRGLHPLTVPAFSVQYNEKITKCLLLCLFLCKSGLLKVCTHYSLNGFETDTGFPRVAACVPLYWWYHGL